MLTLATVLTPATIVCQTSYQPIGKLVDSSEYGYYHAYAPSIVYINSTFHAFYCSNGASNYLDTAGEPLPAWDSVRYVTSADGRLWSSPQVVLSASSGLERAVCDPSLVHFDAGDGPYFYLFYSGNLPGLETVMFVARSATIAGPYKKYTVRQTWEVNPHDPQVIIVPKRPVHQSYGAGQQSVLEKGGVLFSWYTDTTEAPGTQKIYLTSTANPVSWPVGAPTNVNSVSVDVKFDASVNEFVMFSIEVHHAQTSRLLRRHSSDGLTWSAPDVICDTPCFPDFSHNVGVSGDAQGHLIAGRTLVVFGAPFDLDPRYVNNCAQAADQNYCWGRWDLFGGAVNAASKLWNDIAWGWQWAGMGANHRLVLGDYDGDGKTDRAIVDPDTGQWYVIGSSTPGAQGVPGIPWGWQWAGMGINHRLALGDYDGDGKTDRAIVDPDTGQWYVIGSSTPGAQGVPGIPWGWQWAGMGINHRLALGDYDGDGKTDRAIVDPDTGQWYVIGSSTPGAQGVPGI